MHFLILAKDGADEEAGKRRDASRPSHRALVKKLTEEGHLISAGGILNDDNDVAGSFMVMNFDTQEEFDQYLQAEPFIVGGVWKNIQTEKALIKVAQPLPE